jgi:polyhydroxyalkanoate synthesis regulator phasin
MQAFPVYLTETQPPASEPDNELKKLADALQNEIGDSASLAQQYRTIVKYMTKASSLGKAAPEQPVSAAPQVIEFVKRFVENRGLSADKFKTQPRFSVYDLEEVAAAYAASLRHEIAALKEQEPELRKSLESTRRDVARRNNLISDLRSQVAALKEENERLHR